MGQAKNSRTPREDEQMFGLDLEVSQADAVSVWEMNFWVRLAALHDEKTFTTKDCLQWHHSLENIQIWSHKILQLEHGRTVFNIRFEALHRGISISFQFAITPCLYLNYREAEVPVMSPWFFLNHISHLAIVEKPVARYWFSRWTTISLSDGRDMSCAIRFCTSASW